MSGKKKKGKGKKSPKVNPIMMEAFMKQLKGIGLISTPAKKEEHKVTEKDESGAPGPVVSKQAAEAEEQEESESESSSACESSEDESSSSEESGITEFDDSKEEDPIPPFVYDIVREGKLMDFSRWFVRHHPMHPLKYLLKRNLLAKCTICKRYGHKAKNETTEKGKQQITKKKCPLSSRRMDKYRERFPNFLYKKIGRLIYDQVFNKVIVKMLRSSKLDKEIDELITDGTFDKFVTRAIMRGQYYDFAQKLPIDIDRPPSSSGEEEDLIPPIPKIKDKKKDKKKDEPKPQDPKVEEPKKEDPENKTG